MPDRVGNENIAVAVIITIIVIYVANLAGLPVSCEEGEKVTFSCLEVFSHDGGQVPPRQAQRVRKSAQLRGHGQ